MYADIIRVCIFPENTSETEGKTAHFDILLLPFSYMSEEY